MNENAKKIVTAYVYDSDLKAKANEQKKNYWYEYIKEINEQLGLNAKEISSKFLTDKKMLDDISILFIGELPPSRIT
ncbi:MAG: hypothetical protein AAB116_07040, partial [Candidatus Poribacteria bacterium]